MANMSAGDPPKPLDRIERSLLWLQRNDDVFCVETERGEDHEAECERCHVIAEAERAIHALRAPSPVVAEVVKEIRAEMAILEKVHPESGAVLSCIRRQRAMADRLERGE